MLDQRHDSLTTLFIRNIIINMGLFHLVLVFSILVANAAAFHRGPPGGGYGGPPPGGPGCNKPGPPPSGGSPPSSGSSSSESSESSSSESSESSSSEEGCDFWCHLEKKCPVRGWFRAEDDTTDCAEILEDGELPIVDFNDMSPTVICEDVS